MRHGKNRNQTFNAFLRKAAVVTNRSDLGIFARLVVRKFKRRSYDKMLKEAVDDDATEALRIVHGAYENSLHYCRVDACRTYAGWEPMQVGCHRARTFLCV